MTQLATSAEPLLVKAAGDLTTATAAAFRQQLQEALQADCDVLVDLARPSIIDGECFATLLIARNAIEGAGHRFQIKLGHSDWAEFRIVSGLLDCMID